MSSKVTKVGSLQQQGLSEAALVSQSSVQEDGRNMRAVSYMELTLASNIVLKSLHTLNGLMFKEAG